MSKTARCCAASLKMRAATASSDPAMAIKTLPGAKGSRPIPGLLQFPGGTFAAGQSAEHSAPLRKRASAHCGPARQSKSTADAELLDQRGVARLVSAPQIVQ